MVFVCKGICNDLDIVRSGSCVKQNYARCSECNIWYKKRYLRCPCCNNKLRKIRHKKAINHKRMDITDL